MKFTFLKSAGFALCVAALATSAHAQTSLADVPLFTSANVPGNLGLLLSVEFPTATSVAHTNRNYSGANEYLGLFDPNKCYDYRYVALETAVDKSYFYPSAVAVAASRSCSGKWSGNFLNWASMQTIDPFRWVLTGGYRVIDTANLTVTEKAWATGQGSANNFPNSSIPSSVLANATPFPASNGILSMRITGLGNKMRFAVPNNAGSNIVFTGKYFNNITRTGSPVKTRTDSSIDFDWGNGSPDPLVNSDNFSAIWTGSATAPTTGNYQFQVKGDDQIELFVNGVSLINQTSYQGNAYQESGFVNLNAGDAVAIKVNFREDGGGSGAQLQWKKPGETSYTTMGVGGTPSLYNAATPYDQNVANVPGTVYEVFIRSKVCDANAVPGNATASLEENCTAYGSNYKPEGLLQKYSNKIRYSAFGYLNDGNILRDGGVLRAKQKFVGPTKPVPGSTPLTNAGAEWDASTGIFTRNPDAADATDTNTLFGTAVADSGVINYLNKFGEINPGSYKTYDNVGELYYAATRYLKNLGNVPEWTNMTGASAGTKTTWVDGFPVINTWPDPIIYSCQRNFLLGIGDTNTHADKNIPGSTRTTTEPPMPAAVSADTTVNAQTVTDLLGVVDGRGSSLGTTNTSNQSGYLMAGLAYDSHTKDIRADLAGEQTIDTYWVNVQEGQVEQANNQFYLATKYGGFTVPSGFDPYTRTTALPDGWWYTNTDLTKANQKRPDNYFSGGRPDLMKAGLEKAFADIASKIKAYTTSFSTSLPQVAVTGNKSYSSLYNAADWTGEIAASILSFDAATSDPSLVQTWTFSNLLATQLAGAGWNTGRRVATWNGTTGTGVAFRSSAITSAQLSALDPSYVTGNDSSNYLNYLRGDQTNELNSVVTGSTKAYRVRTKLLGDIVGSKARPIGPPNFPFSDAVNPGYSAFKTLWKNRPTVVYVGSNDGMLHAVRGDLTAPPGGAELFAYVPSVLFQGPNGTPSDDGLASLGNPSFVHHFLVNATPNAYDIDFGRTPDDATKTARTATPDWRTVLIGGLGKGGKSYYALDVTDPTGGMSTSETTLASKVLWEFSVADDAGLGFTYGEPVVVKTKKYGWVVILPSGYNNTNGQGQFLIINPRTGKLLEKVSTGAGSPTNTAGLAYANGFVVDASDGTADSVYAGDLLGNLWRWDLTAASGTYPAPLKIAKLTDASSNPLPVTSRPMIEVHPRLKKRFVMVGTGRLLDNSDISDPQGQSFFAISDGTNISFNVAANLPTGITFPITRAKLAANSNALVGVTFDPVTQMGWYEDLGVGSGIGWRVTSDPTTLLGSVAFAAVLPNGSICSPSGDSRVYARDYAVGKTTLKALVSGVLTPTVMVPITGNVTDLRYLSVNGKGTLISGTDAGKVQKVEINPISGLGMRRLNWRELQLVE